MDIIFVIDTILPLGALVWAAVAKDPGFNPRSLIEQLRRRGRVRPEEIARLDLGAPFDAESARRRWTDALDAAEEFVAERPAEEMGCLYWDAAAGRFVEPGPEHSLDEQGLVVHFGRPGGIHPRPSRQSLDG